jgi:hypothetical protein
MIAGIFVVHIPNDTTTRSIGFGTIRWQPQRLKPGMLLSDCQARSKAKFDFHFNAALTAVNLVKLEACQQ